MGGKALSANVAIRLTKANYERLASECVAKLRAAYPGMRIEVLGNYLDKADFGDCDILIESSDAYDPHQAAGVLEAVEVVRNGPVTSIGVIVRPEAPFRDGNVFQVDLIRMPLEAFDFDLAYFGRGDAGNLLGRIARAMGRVARPEEQAEYGKKKMQWRCLDAGHLCERWSDGCTHEQKRRVLHATSRHRGRVAP